METPQGNEHEEDGTSGSDLASSDGKQLAWVTSDEPASDTVQQRPARLQVFHTCRHRRVANPGRPHHRLDTTRSKRSRLGTILADHTTLPQATAVSDRWGTTAYGPLSRILVAPIAIAGGMASAIGAVSSVTTRRRSAC